MYVYIYCTLAAGVCVCFYACMYVCVWVYTVFHHHPTLPSMHCPDPVEVFPERPIGPFSDAVPENAKFLVLFRLPKLCASAELQAFVSQHRAAAEQ